MTLRTRLPAAVSVLAFLTAGCSSSGGGGGTQPPPPPVGCASPTPITLAVGGHVVVDPATSNGCIRFPSVASGGANQEYYAAVVSGSGLVTTSGVSGSYTFKAGGQSAAAPPAQAASPDRPPVDNAAVFHGNLRNLESALAADPANRAPLKGPPVSTVPPVVGTQRTFNVCSNLQCNAFAQVTAMARYVGTRAAVYLDLTVPGTDTLTQADLDELGQTFDQRLHPIVLTAFGAESDIDANQVVAILLTDAVNALTPDCTNGRVLGYFWGGDLLTTVTSSNRGEVFYGMVPAPATSGCTAATRRATVDRLKPTMIHELQHMISFNQHVFVSGGSSGEVAWLNEGLSHYAEELGGKLIPNSECPSFPSCRSQYTSGDLSNAYQFLEDPEANFLVFPSTSVGTLSERGAAWLFVRWMADHWGSDSLGTNLTRALVQTSLTGATNVQTATGTSFASLVAEWLAAVWLDDLADFTPLSERISYTSWGFRKVFADNCCGENSPFPRAWPSEAPLVIGNYTRSSTLRGGSGKVYQVIQTGGSPALDVTLARDVGGNPLSPALAARITVVRIR